MQTSGEVGRFYIDPDSEGVKLGRKPLQPSRTSIESSFNLGLSQPEPPRRLEQKTKDSGRSMSSSRTREDSCFPSSRLSIRTDTTGAGFTSSNLPRGPHGSDQYLSTLQRLDSSFSNTNRRDLFAASMPSRPARELVWCVARNSIGAQATKSWAEHLRHKSSM